MSELWITWKRFSFDYLGNIPFLIWGFTKAEPFALTWMSSSSFYKIQIQYHHSTPSPGWSKTATGHTSRRAGGTFSDVQPKSKLPILRKKRRITKFDYSFHLLQVSIECLVSVSFAEQMMMVNCWHLLDISQFCLFTFKYINIVGHTFTICCHQRYDLRAHFLHSSEEHMNCFWTCL